MARSNENTRTSGAPIWTPLSQLPERFTYGPHTRLMSEYLSRRWRAQSYGWWERLKPILYNPEWIPESQKRSASPDRYRWVENCSGGLRVVGKVHEIRMSGDGNLPYIDRDLIGHTGWYTDNYQSETVCGMVFQLPTRRHHLVDYTDYSYSPPRRKQQWEPEWEYCPGIDDPSNNNCAIIDFHSRTSDIREAARWADKMAEQYAEDEREYQARESAKERIAEIETEIKASYRAFRELAREVRANCDKLAGLTRLHSLIREHWQDTRREIEELRREKRKLEEDFWTVCPNY